MQDFDPYATLDVDITADDAAIKAAYRRQAKSAHPDAGGSRDAWDAVERAYGLLTDQRRRKHYDRTGHVDDGFADDLSAAAAGHLEMTFFKVVNDCLTTGHNVDSLDLIKIMVGGLQHEIAGIIVECGQADEKITVIEKMRKWLRFKGKGPNLFDHVLKNRSQLLGQFLANQRRGQEVRERAIELLKGYEYAFDKAPGMQGFGQGLSATDLIALGKQQHAGFWPPR
jgi:curved DNA-binding protein CbpA